MAFREADGAVPVADHAREAAVGPRERLAVSGHRLVSARRRRPGLLRVQPRRARRASTRKASATRRTTARSRTRSSRARRRRHHLEARHDGRARRQFPHNLANSSPVAYGDLIYHQHLERAGREPRERPVAAAPAIIARQQEDRQAGLGRQLASGDKILHGQWSTPAVGTDRRRRSGRDGAGRRLGARLRGEDRQEAVGVRHEPEGFGLAQDAQRGDQHAGHRRRTWSISPTARIPSTAKASGISTASTRPSAATSPRRGRVWHYDKIRRSISTGGGPRRAGVLRRLQRLPALPRREDRQGPSGCTTCSPRSGARRSWPTARCTSATRTATSSSWRPGKEKKVLGEMNMGSSVYSTRCRPTGRCSSSTAISCSRSANK